MTQSPKRVIFIGKQRKRRPKYIPSIVEVPSCFNQNILSSESEFFMTQVYQVCFQFNQSWSFWVVSQLDFLNFATISVFSVVTD